MEVHVNTDNHLNLSERLSAELQEELEKKLHKFRTHITTLSIHLSDLNSDKGGDDDKNCLIEARLERKRPIAASHRAMTLQEAVTGAARKMERMVRNTLERQRNH